MKKRVREVLYYQKPKAWLSLAAAMLCAITAACFLTDPIAPSTEAAVERQESQTLSPPEAGTAGVEREADAPSEGITVNGFFILSEEVEQAVYIYNLSENKEISTQVFLSPEQQTILYVITQNGGR